MVASGGRDSVGKKDWEFWISRCIQLHIEWINKKVLQYSTENCIQYLIISYNGKEYEKEYKQLILCFVINFSERIAEYLDKSRFLITLNIFLINHFGSQRVCD